MVREREENTVTSVNGFDLLKRLPKLDQPAEKNDYIAQEVILKELKDEHSLPAYRLIAAKAPEQIIRQAISEIKADGAKEPVKVFMHKMKEYAKKVADKTSSSI